MNLNSKNIVDKIIKDKEIAENKERKEIENLKLACKELFKDNNGKFFLKFIKKSCGWNEQDNNINPEILIYKKGRRDIWTIIRNIIPKEILSQVEIYDN